MSHNEHGMCWRVCSTAKGPSTSSDRREYYWPGMRKLISEYCSTCDACPRAKPSRHKLYGLLKQLPIPERPWESISLDFITELPNSIISQARSHEAKELLDIWSGCQNRPAHERLRHCLHPLLNVRFAIIMLSPSLLVKSRFGSSVIE